MLLINKKKEIKKEKRDLFGPSIYTYSEHYFLNFRISNIKCLNV